MKKTKTRVKKKEDFFATALLRRILSPVLVNPQKESDPVASAIPEFPHFKKLEFSDKAAVENFTHNHPPYSDFNFISMWSWDIEDKMKLSRLNGNLIVRFTDYLTNEPFFSFLGESKVPETIQALLDISEKEGLQRKLKLIPEIAIQHIKPTGSLVIIEDPDNFDYLYLLGKLATYDGNRLRSKRNLCNRFERAYRSQSKTKTLHSANRHTQEEILGLLDVWKERKNQEINTNEFAAIGRALHIAEISDLIFVGLFIDNTLEGFVIDELLKDDYALLHFEKANKNFIGIYSYLMEENAKILSSFGKKVINFEQDLGISGLRLSKKAFKPSAYLKKYIITDRMV